MAEIIDPNSLDLDPDQVLCYLSLGSREPQNDYERRVLADVREAEAKGYIIEIPFN
jgi:hypothetical protein